MKPVALLLAVALCFAACSKDEQPPPPPDQHARLESLRQELRQTFGARYDEPVPAATVAQLKRGSALFAELCAGCHGARGDGRTDHPGVLLQQPSNFTDPVQATFFSEQARLHIIRKGIAGTAMIGWEGMLPEEDILAIYQYVRHLYQSR